MIYSYSTLLNEKSLLLNRLKELNQIEDKNEELYAVIQEIKYYINDLESALEILEDETFVK